ncbi:hypothetical protein DFJ67_2344 [Asanoa ferruginea]|uniref:Lipoprotein n=1 Tax=Asanoa ferruginea TaxID=53367 RepID=A0A3D9ZGG6_9ACTN|nr:hypothetical protein [Asanoa ferruginea]REF96365.1 hypothetical protein DFJ67_2344 [Asanoa ferruginea]GIF47011.1 hypothetical protein Afe04nite_15500 [Asanoa ferruginea]
MTLKRRIAVPLLALGLGIGLAACKGPTEPARVASAGGASSTPSPAGGKSDEERGRDFAECMREQGVDLPDPQPGGKVDMDGIDKDKAIGAVVACRDVMPNGGEYGKLDPGQLEKQRALAVCMRANGVPDFPDPDPAGESIRDYLFDKHDDGVLTALDKCRDAAPTPGAGR